MRTKRRIMILLALVLLVTCMPLTAMASENHNKVIQKIDILADGYYITNADGSIVSKTRGYIVDEKVVLKPGQSLNASNNVWYNGNILAFYASVSNAKVTNLELKAKRVGNSKFKSLGSFVAVQGNWYGALECIGMPDGWGCNYQIKFTNNGSTTMTIDSLTGEEYTP